MQYLVVLNSCYAPLNSNLQHTPFPPQIPAYPSAEFVNFLVYTIRKEVLASAGRVDNFSSYKQTSQPETRPQKKKKRMCTYLFRVHNRMRTLQEVKFKLVIPEGRSR